MPQLENFSHDQQGHALCIWGSCIPNKSPFAITFPRGNFERPKVINKAMSKCQVSVEIGSLMTISYFKFVDFKKNLKLGLSPIDKMYIVCTLLHNARACLYGTSTSRFFEMDPHELKIIFINNFDFSM